MKVPPKRKGNTLYALAALLGDEPSMKVPPKRKGNSRITKVEEISSGPQ